MARITFIQHDSMSQVIEIKSGQTIMEAAVKANVANIDADCGGACSCATCHVHVDEGWTELIGRPSEIEAAMLEFAENVESGSRLACQIKVTDALDGLVLRVPQALA
jgi:2Fe-2S ferredoxin